MIGYLRGKVVFVQPEYAVVETGGLGYRVFLSASTLAKLEKEREVKLYIYTSVREDAILLYGFFDSQEYNIFLKLISVSGIGPKVALGILSFISPDSFRLAILNQDLKVLTKLPGVGKKTAERLMLELRDKLGFTSEEKDSLAGFSLASLESTGQSNFDEALQALVALGYEKGEVLPLLKKNTQPEMSVEELIKVVLKGFAGR